MLGVVNVGGGECRGGECRTIKLAQFTLSSSSLFFFLVPKTKDDMQYNAQRRRCCKLI